MSCLQCAPLRALLVAAVIVLPAAAADQENDDANAPAVDDTIRQLVQDRDYGAAIESIDKALKQQENAPREELMYLKGRALHHLKQYEAAVVAFDQIARQFPKSPWARRARFASGVSLARKGDFRAAELIYREQAKSLLSDQRKQEMAGIYIEFADDYFDPPEKDREPDYARAFEFYVKALEVGSGGDKQVEVALRAARCQQLLDKTLEAVGRYEELIRQHPDASQTIEARFCLGECLMALKKTKEARRTWQDLLTIHRGSPSEWIPRATFQRSRTWGMPKPESDEQLNLGVAALDEFVKRFPAHKLAGQAHLDVAKAFIHRGRSEDAALRLEQLLADKRYADSDQMPQARNLLGHAYQMQKKFAAALTIWREYLVNISTPIGRPTVPGSGFLYVVASGRLRQTLTLSKKRSSTRWKSSILAIDSCGTARLHLARSAAFTRNSCCRG